MWVLKGIILFILLHFSVQLFAFQQQANPFSWDTIPNQYHIRNYTVKDGLPINSVNHITHHSDGYLYVGTNDGLARFDGVRFSVFNTVSHSAMQSNRIKWILSEKDGDLWFSDFSSNLYLLQGNTITWVQEKEIFKELVVIKISSLNNGNTIIDTKKGLYEYKNGRGLSQIQHEVTQQEIINSFILDGTTIELFVADGWYSLIDGEATKRKAAKEFLLPVDGISNLKKTRNGNFWFLGLNNELLKVEGNGQQELFTYREKEQVIFWNFKELNENILLLSTNIGYLRFNRSTGKFEETEQVSESEGYFKDNAWTRIEDVTTTKFQNKVYINGDLILDPKSSVPFLTADREGSIWVATSNAGLFQISKKKMIILDSNTHPALKNMYGLDTYKNSLWATSFENGVLAFNEDGITNWNRENSNINYTFFRSVEVIDSEIAYAGSFNLWKYEDSMWTRDFSFGDDRRLIDALLYDSQNQLWVGTAIGLHYFDGQKYVLYRDSNGNSVTGVKTIQELKQGEFLIATTGNGVVRLSPEKERIQIDIEDGLSSNLIRDVYVDSPDTLWVVSEDNGLNRVIISEDWEVREVKHFNTKDGLLGNSLHRIIEDSFGFIWINSNQGIMRINKKALNNYLDKKRTGFIVQGFTEEDGLVNIEGNGGVQNAGVLTEDGSLLFPNQDGLIYTRPEWHIKKKGKGLNIPVFETISISDSVRNVMDVSEITFSKDERNIQVKFTLPTFAETHKLELEYKMEGVNETWQKTNSDRIAVFTNIPSGNNKLSIRGYLKGLDEYSNASMIINVKPYFYETTWFILLSICLLAGIFYSGYKILLRQSKLREMNLEGLVNDRTKELVAEKEKTEEALQTIKKLDESKSQFFTNFTHELRTPLSLILSPLEEMLENKSIQTNGNKVPLSLMMRSANRLKSLVNQLLEVSKLNSGEISLTFQEVDIVNKTQHNAAQFEHAFEKKNIEFYIDFKEDVDLVFIDVSAWEHVCTNLLGNALKFTPQGGRVSIRINNEDEYVKVLFEDFGTGIAKSDLPFIFDPYYQGDSSIAKSGGTGIGLAIVKGMVEKMGGKIAVQSSKIEGTKFEVSLRKGKDHISEKHKIVREPIETLDEVKPGFIEPANQDDLIIAKGVGESAPKVLIVEDNEDFRMYLYSVIGRRYNVQVAPNGKLGLDVLENFHPDIIISDIMMPEMNGYEMMKSIRSKIAFKHVPFIFLSAKDSNNEIETGLNMGADIYLTKPVQNKLLLAQIKVLLRRENKLKSSEDISEKASKNTFTAKTTEIIKRHLGNPDLNIDLIAEALSMSTASLYRKWKKENDETINHIINMLRFEESLKLIEEEDLNISEASYAVGFSTLSYYSRAFKKMYGLPPQEYLRQSK